ncbi:hypothetical protein DFJ74DRAFT_207456 [Hyaloraphidium curvatum]|nr:hypothetical protein DFJ74DRAFT_207456 [Hyaloraphidium curvatum]
MMENRLLDLFFSAKRSRAVRIEVRDEPQFTLQQCIRKPMVMTYNKGNEARGGRPIPVTFWRFSTDSKHSHIMAFLRTKNVLKKTDPHYRRRFAYTIAEFYKKRRKPLYPWPTPPAQATEGQMINFYSCPGTPATTWVLGLDCKILGNDFGGKMRSRRSTWTCSTGSSPRPSTQPTSSPSGTPSGSETLTSARSRAVSCSEDPDDALGSALELTSTSSFPATSQARRDSTTSRTRSLGRRTTRPRVSSPSARRSRCSRASSASSSSSPTRARCSSTRPSNTGCRPPSATSSTRSSTCSAFTSSRSTSSARRSSRRCGRGE